MERLAAAGRELRRAATWHRRLLAAGLAAAAMALALEALEPAAPDRVTVAAAARDLPAGATLRAGDLVQLGLPRAAVPAGALPPGRAVQGRVLAGPVRAGEPLTDVRLVGPALLRGYGPAYVAAPVRIADTDVAKLLEVGDVVDVLAADPQARRPTAVVAAAAPVLAVPRPGRIGLQEGSLVVLAVARGVAGRLAQAGVTSPLSVVLRR